MDIDRVKAGQIDHLGFRLWTAEQVYVREMMSRLADHGFADLTPGLAQLLAYLDIDGTRLTELSVRSGITKQGVGQTVKELCRLNYVEVVPDPSDKRAKLVRYTQRGLTFLGAAQKVKAALHAEVTALLGPRKTATLISALETVAAAFQQK